MTERWQRSPIAQSALSMVIPIVGLNADLEEVIAGWHGHLEGRGKPFEILLVNDGGPEPLRERLKELAAKYRKARVLKLDHKQGVGAALREGIAAAQYPLLLTTTGDRQFAPETLKALLAQIDQVDVVLGVRQAPPMPAFFRRLGWVYRLGLRILVGLQLEGRPAWQGWAEWRRRWLVRCLFGLGITDPECPLRVYRRAIFDRIPLQSKGGFALYEILAKANFLSCLFKEVVIANSAGTSTWDMTSFGAEALRVFQHPDFGPAQARHRKRVG